MITLHLALILFAAVAFLAGAIDARRCTQFIALGLALLTLSLLPLH